MLQSGRSYLTYRMIAAANCEQAGLGGVLKWAGIYLNGEDHYPFG